jgi:hypothetical protein
MKAAWITLSLFLLLACTWFAAMELILHRPDFELRTAVAALLVIYCALSLVYTRTPSATLRGVLFFGALAATTLGIYALCTELRAAHFEGYILLIALALTAQGVLALMNTFHHPRLHTA